MTSFTGVLQGPRFARDDTGLDPLLESQASRWVYGATMTDINRGTQITDTSQDNPAV